MDTFFCPILVSWLEMCIHVASSIFNPYSLSLSSSLSLRPQSIDPSSLSSPYPLQYLEYTVYQKCLGRGKFSVSAMMDAIEDMLTASLTLKQVRRERESERGEDFRPTCKRKLDD